MGQVVGHQHAALGVLDHPHGGGDDGDGHLQGRGVLVGHQAAGLLDAEVAARPPGIVGVAHDEGAQDIGAAGDLIGHDPQLGLQLVVVAAQLVQGDDRVVAGAVGVVHRGPVDRLAVLPHRELVGEGEGLAVADHHALDRVVGDPGAHAHVHAHAGQADLVLRAIRVLVGQGRELLLVGAPAHLGRGDALLAEAFDAPGVHELVHLLGLVADLGVPLAAMDDLDAQLPGQVVEGAALGQRSGARSASAPLARPSASMPGGDVQQPLLGPVGDEAGVGSVLQHGSGAGGLPAGDQPADLHVAPVEGHLGGVLLVGARV